MRALPVGFGEHERRGRFGWLFALVCLFYLAYPFRSAWELADPVESAATLAALVAFVLVYGGAFYVFRTSTTGGKQWPRPDQRLVWSAIAILTALTLVVAIPLGSDALAMSVYLCVLAALALPTRATLAVAVVVVGAILLLPQLFSGWESNEGLAFQVAVSTFAGWGVSQIVLRNRQLLAAREQLAVLAVAEERSRVARDVHDILGHSLTVITVKSELAQRLLEVDRDRARAELADIERLSREALAGVRDTVGGLREVSLDGELANARTALSAAGIKASLPSVVDQVPPSRQKIFGWVLREGVTNMVRHSGARNAEVTVTPSAITIADDGKGFAAQAESGSGHGLDGLRERVTAAGGILRLGSAPGKGFRLTAEFSDAVSDTAPL
jgi:two-component system sensor histidine kinase DesK